MDRTELKAELDRRGIPYIKQWGEKRLNDALRGSEKPVDESKPETAPTTPPNEGRAYTDEELKHISDEVSGKNTPTVDETLAMTQRDDGNAVTPSGIIIPPEVLAKWPRTQYRFVVKSSQDKCEVLKIDERGKEHFVRTYERSVHGDDFNKLAQQFVEKNNKKSL